MITANTYFSGIGMLDIGLQQAGITIGQAFELDADACKTYRANHSHKLVDGDLICQDCWEEYRSIDNDIEYSDLPEFVPEADKKIEVLTEGLIAIKKHMEFVGGGRLGNVWHIADAILTKAEAIGK